MKIIIEKDVEDIEDKEVESVHKVVSGENVMDV